MCPPYLLVSYPEIFSLLERSPLLHAGSLVFVVRGLVARGGGGGLGQAGVHARTCVSRGRRGAGGGGSGGAGGAPCTLDRLGC